MWKYVSLRRDSDGLLAAKREVDALRDSMVIPQGETRMLVKGLETENMLTVADLVIEAALHRQESRGSHWRSDFPEADEALAGFHYVFRAAREQNKQLARNSKITECQVPAGETPEAPSKEMAHHASTTY